MKHQTDTQWYFLLRSIGRIAAVLLAFAVVILLFTGFTAEKKTYFITDNHLNYKIESYADNVEDVLTAAGLTLGPTDRIDITMNDDTTQIAITRCRIDYTRETESVPYERLRQADYDMAPGAEEVIQPGSEGSRTHLKRVTVTGGRPAEETYLGVTAETDPVPEIVAFGTAVRPVAQSALSITDDILVARDESEGTITTSSGRAFRYSKVLTCTATAYTTQRQSWKLTATGTTARVGAIAVDPRVIPYGTRMYIVSSDGSITYGTATAEDCGGSIKGHKIDLFFNTYDECIQFGRRSCTVYVLD